MALKTKQIRKQPQAERATRKSKFQADLAPAEDRMVRGLKQELQLTSNTDFLSDAWRCSVGQYGKESAVIAFLAKLKRVSARNWCFRASNASP